MTGTGGVLLQSSFGAGGDLIHSGNGGESRVLSRGYILHRRGRPTAHPYALSFPRTVHERILPGLRLGTRPRAGEAAPPGPRRSLAEASGAAILAAATGPPLCLSNMDPTGAHRLRQ